MDATRWTTAALTFAVLAGCAPAARPGAGPVPAASLALVDSIPWANDLSEGVLRRVEVRSGGRADTIPGVLTAEMPVLIPRSRVLGFAYEEDALTSVFEYDVRARALRLGNGWYRVQGTVSTRQVSADTVRTLPGEPEAANGGADSSRPA
jgi:hypothetical protein